MMCGTMRFRMALTVMMLITAVQAGIAEPWLPVRDGKLRGIGGMELLEESTDGTSMFLIVHDNKQPAQQRIAIVTVKGEEVDYYKVAWRGEENAPADLEALATLPDGGGKMFWAMTSEGFVTEFRLVEKNPVAEVVRQFTLPGILPEADYEGLVAKPIDGKTLVAWGSRGLGSTPGVLYWGVLEGDEVRQEGWASHRVPWPEGENVRHLSDITMDDSGNLYVSAASDPGDDGPFESAVYRAGSFALREGHFVFEADIKEVTRSSGHKIEGIALLAAEPVRMAFGTDNENGGSSFYSYGESIVPEIGRRASEPSRTALVLLLALAGVALLWLKELSQRRAIEAAQHCLGSISELLVYEVCTFATYREQDGGRRFAPGWTVVYGYRSGTDGGSLELHASVFGDVTGSNIPAVSEAVSLDASSRTDRLASYARELQGGGDAEEQDPLSEFPSRSQIKDRENLTPPR